jgi:hypothetical protein
LIVLPGNRLELEAARVGQYSRITI